MQGLLQGELRYLEAEQQLWSSMRDSGDPQFYTASERYAKQLEVSAWTAAKSFLCFVNK